MPLYTAITQEGSVSDEIKAKIAEEITRIHATLMKVPRNFVRVVFISYPKRSGYTAGEAAPTAALNCVLRSGHTAEEKTELLEQLWSMFDVPYKGRGAASAGSRGSAGVRVPRRRRDPRRLLDS